MAFRKKFESVISLKPDLLVILECENDEKLKKALTDINYNELIWYGTNPHKGVGIISFNEYHIELNKDFNKEYEFIIPLKLRMNERSINLFAVWAMPHKSIRKLGYVSQIWRAMNYYVDLLDEEVIIVGDFNSNTFWDKPRKIGTHSELVAFLNTKNIKSIYHYQQKIQHGSEKQPTLYLLKNKQRPYHIDYCFVSSSLISAETKIRIGKYNDWIKLSDHMPLIIEDLAI